MSREFTDTTDFRGARIQLSDLTGLEIRDCEVDGLRIVDCYGSDVSVSGDFQRIVVNDVDVTDYVQAELDRTHPTRALARDVHTPDDYRAAWSAISADWTATIEEARVLGDTALNERVAGEWSLVETLRHLLFASDAWLGNAVLEEDTPYHPWGIPAGGMPESESAALGLTIDARPSLDEVLAARAARIATYEELLERLDQTELDRRCARKPADPYPDQEYVVGRCLRVILREEAEHHRYATRDLALLTPDSDGSR